MLFENAKIWFQNSGFTGHHVHRPKRWLFKIRHSYNRQLRNIVYFDFVSNFQTKRVVTKIIKIFSILNRHFGRCTTHVHSCLRKNPPPSPPSHTTSINRLYYWFTSYWKYRNNIIVQLLLSLKPAFHNDHNTDLDKTITRYTYSCP